MRTIERTRKHDFLSVFPGARLCGARLHRDNNHRHNDHRDNNHCLAIA